MTETLDLTVIIPCYNEEEVLPLFHKELTSVLEKDGCTYELLFINDGSSDHTQDILENLASNDSHVLYIQLSRNFGKESAIYAGFCNYHGTYAALMDADLQDPPEMLTDMLNRVRSGSCDCAAAVRTTRKGEPFLRSRLSEMFYAIINRMSDTPVVSGARDFRVMNASMAEAIVRMGEYNRFSKGLFSWVGFRTEWIPYANHERAAGKTKWNFFSLFRYAMDGIMNFSNAPLALASWIGLTMTMISFIALIFIIVRKLIFGDPVAGWASTICVIIFIGGLQLFCLGIIGQYIAKIYLESKKRPHYIASKTNMNTLRNMQ